MDTDNYIQVKKLYKEARLPTKAHAEDAGWDLYSLQYAMMHPKSRILVPTGISMAIPTGFVGLIWPKSGLAVKNGIDVLAGVIDAGYRGEIKVCLYNSGDSKVWINKGDKIAQLLIQPIFVCDIYEVDSLDETTRGDGGFGSTGI